MIAFVGGWIGGGIVAVVVAVTLHLSPGVSMAVGFVGATLGILTATAWSVRR